MARRTTSADSSSSGGAAVASVAEVIACSSGAIAVSGKESSLCSGSSVLNKSSMQRAGRMDSSGRLEESLRSDLGSANSARLALGVNTRSSERYAPSLRSAGSSVLVCDKTQSMAVVTTSLDAAMLRAVRVSTVLRCCCQSFSSNSGTDENYQKSFRVTQIADFMSHDWSSSRCSKLLGLCLIYNGGAALIASLVVAYVLAALQYGADPMLPAPLPPPPFGMVRTRKFCYWCEVICPIVFTFFFLFWQDMRELMLLGTRTCFVDKFCIDQDNPERKAAGIFGLAGFLRCSKWFIVLWTPRYFTRLWCTFEVASWLYLQKPLNTVLLMPLEHAKTISTLTFGCYCGFLCVNISVLFFPSLYPLAVTLGCFVPITIGAHQARRSAHHLRAMTNQLASFSVTSSYCHCCTMQHKNTAGSDVPCDREVVYSTIAEWFGEDDGNDAALERFDQAVRKVFAPKVLAKAGPMQLSYRYTVLVGWPFLFRGCDVLAAADELSDTYFWNIIVMYPTLALVAVPAWYKIAMYLAYSLDMWVGIPENRWGDMAWTLVLGLTYSLIILFNWYPLEVLASIDANVWLMVLASLGLSAAAAGLYIQDIRELAERAAKRFWTPHALRPSMSNDAEPFPQDLLEANRARLRANDEGLGDQSLSAPSSLEVAATATAHADLEAKRTTTMISL